MHLTLVERDSEGLGLLPECSVGMKETKSEDEHVVNILLVYATTEYDKQSRLLTDGRNYARWLRYLHVRAMHEQSTNHITLKNDKTKQKPPITRCNAKKVTHCTGHVLANIRHHQLCWGDREMGTAISCTECGQVAGCIQ